jgi:hypothetical protein
MAEVSPHNMLALYRRDSTFDQSEQARAVRSMSTKDALELLAYMHIHCVAVVQQLHSRLDAEEAQTQGMPDIGKAN